MRIGTTDGQSLLSSSPRASAQMPESEAAELRWLAEAIVGDPEVADSCIASGLLQAAEAICVAPNWRERWIRRCIARYAVERRRAEIKEIITNYRRDVDSTLAFDELAWSRQALRCLTPAHLCEALNVFERAALILHLYLSFSVHDCSLLLDCNWSLIEPACLRALWRLFGALKQTGITASELIRPIQALQRWPR